MEYVLGSIIFFYFPCAIVFGVIASVIMSERGEGWFLGFVGGLLFGPIGVALAFKSGAQCDACKTRMHWRATVCPRCGAGRRVVEQIAEPRLRRETAEGHKEH